MGNSPPRIVVTGPTGWIGTAMLAYLAKRFGPGWDAAVTLFGSTARPLRAVDGALLDILPLRDIRAAHVDGAIVIHLAYLTKEKVGVLGERAFTDGNLAIDDHLLSALAGASPRSVFVASSGAASLAERGTGREPYGLSKLRQEDRFLDWSAGNGAPVLAGRIFNLGGPYINKVESYAVGSFIGQAQRDQQIRVEARIPVFRSFLHVEDLCALIFETGLAGTGRPMPIDLCGAEVLEMGDIAAAVAAQMRGDIMIVRDDVDWSRSSVYLGDFTQTKIAAMALKLPLTSFKDQIIDTIAWMNEGQGNEQIRPPTMD